jgi:hypothetical protein
MARGNALALVFQVLWVVVTIPFLVILIVYGLRTVEHGFARMATSGPAVYSFMILSLVALVALTSLLLRFNLICVPLRGIGLAALIAALVVDNLSIAFYGKYSSKAEEVQAFGNMAQYCATHVNKDSIWWITYLAQHAGDPSAGLAYVEDRTVTPAKIEFGPGLTGFMIHCIAFYLLIIPKDAPLTEAMLKPGSSTYSA